MVWTSRSTSDLRSLEFRITPVQIGSYPLYQSILGTEQVSVWSSYKLLGSDKTDFFHTPKTKFVPGRFKITQYQATCVNAVCSPTSVDCFGIYNGFTRLTKRVSGPFAAAYGGSMALLPIPAASSDLSSLVTAYARMNESTAECGVMLAEATETLGMLASPFRALPKLLKKLQRPKTFVRKSGSVGSAASYASNAWLTYRYGIIPLLSDVDSIRKLTEKRLSTESTIRRRHGGSSIRNDSSFSITRYPVEGIYCWGGQSTSISNSTRSIVYYRGSMSSGEDMGVDASNILSVAYEIIPYSFVLDWFIDVGTWLKAKRPVPGLSILGNTIAVKSESVIKTTFDKFNMVAYPDYTTPYTIKSSSFVRHFSAYRRDTNIPIPSSPTVSISLSSWKRKLDGVTLLWQRMPQPPRR